jgi:hypothetical protein
MHWSGWSLLYFVAFKIMPQKLMKSLLAALSFSFAAAQYVCVI